MKESTVIARGGKHRIIKDHFLVFSSQPDAMKRGINEHIKDEKLLLIFTNRMTEAQKRVAVKRFDARKDRINRLIEFYLMNNVLYQSLGNSGNQINRLKYKYENAI